MKKLLNTTTAYLIAALAAGVFYREFTKFSGFAGETVLGVGDAHLLALGAGLFLLLALFSGREGGLAESKPFRRFYGLYNISLPFMACTMVVRGVLQVRGTELSRGLDAAISGFAGIAHILMAVSLFLLLSALKKYALEKR